MQFQDISRQALESAASAVTRIHQQTTDVVDYADGTVPAKQVLSRVVSLDELRNAYVMERQRAAHATVTGESVAADTGPAIELF